ARLPGCQTDPTVARHGEAGIIARTPDSLHRDLILRRRKVKLALFDEYRLGVVEGDQIADVTDALEEHDTEWPWEFVPRTIMHFDRIRPRIEAALPGARRVPLTRVQLR